MPTVGGRSRVARNAFARRVAMPLLSRFNAGDIRLAHHWTGDPLTVHSFRHRGYWFYGTRRERETIMSFIRLIGRSDAVVDVGSHIGYLSMLFARLTPGGAVIAVEPASDNLAYLRRNTSLFNNVSIEPVALGASPG